MPQSISRRRFVPAACLRMVMAAAGVTIASAAMAQQPPTAAQVGAIRSACQTDYGKQCHGVPPGGKAALECLQTHLGKVSARCRTAVAAATAPATAPAAPAAGSAIAATPTTPQPTAAQVGAVRSACQADYGKQCRGIPPGGKAALECLQTHLGKVSARCRTAVAAATGPATAPAAPAAGSAIAATPTTPQPTAAQVGAVRSACETDYGKQCRGVPPGGKAAVACLQMHIGMVSPRCRTAVAAATGTAVPAPPRPAGPRTPTPSAPSPTENSSPGEPVAGTPPADATTATEPAATADPAAAPAMAARDALIPDPDAPALSRRLPLPLPPLQELGALRALCGTDFRALCANAGVGGGRAIGCLKDNTSLLSPKCKRAIVAARTR